MLTSLIAYQIAGMVTSAASGSNGRLHSAPTNPRTDAGAPSSATPVAADHVGAGDAGGAVLSPPEATVGSMNASELQRRAGMVAHAGHDLEGLCLAFDGLLRQTVPYQVAAWSTQDPATGLFTSCTMSGIAKDPEREARLFANEFGADEPSTYRSLIATNRTVAVLSEVTAGDLDRADRYRDLLQPFGITDELRAVLWADGMAWGSATLYRLDGRFHPDEAQRVASVAPSAAMGMRLVLLRTAASRPATVPDPPGILGVTPDGQVEALTTPAQRWLQLGGTRLTTTAISTAAAIRQRQDGAGATARLVLDDGRTLVLHAASMTSDDGTVAVIVDAARPAQVGAMLADAYGLSARQRDVLGLLLLGRSLTQIAGELGISEHTVNDHRKVIYRTIGVSSRSELAAILQSEQYDPRSRGGVPPSPYGGFLEVT